MRFICKKMDGMHKVKLYSERKKSEHNKKSLIK